MGDDYLEYIYGNAGQGMSDSDAEEYYRDLNARLAADSDSHDVNHPSPALPRRRISRMPKMSEWYHMPDSKQEKQLPAGPSFPKRGYLPEGLEVFEASRSYLVDGTQVERLGIKNGDRYVTVVRYDGNNNDMVVVDGKGHAVSTTQDYVNGIVLDKLNLEEG